MGKKKAGTARTTQRKAKTAKKKSTAAKSARAKSSKAKSSGAQSTRSGVRSSTKPPRAQKSSARAAKKPRSAVRSEAKAVPSKAVPGQGAVKRPALRSHSSSTVPGIPKGPPRSLKHLEALGEKSRLECHEFFEKGPLEKLLVVFDESYPADLVNFLLDLKKSTVKRFFEVLAGQRKRAVAELITLYYYRDYLTNPLPLDVETMSGESVPNYYAILGVPREATEEELKMAHRLLSRAYNPASFSPAIRSAGGERLVEIDEAYDNLKTPSRRDHSDRVLPNISYLYPRRDQSWLEFVQRILG